MAKRLFLMHLTEKQPRLSWGYEKGTDFFLLLTFGRFLEYEGTNKFVLFVLLDKTALHPEN